MIRRIALAAGIVLAVAAFVVWVLAHYGWHAR